MRVLSNNPLPGWYLALIEALRGRLITHGTYFGGLDYSVNLKAFCEGRYFIDVYPLSVVVERARERIVLVPRFEFDVAGLLQLFDRVVECAYHANGCASRNLPGDYLRVSGYVYGQPVSLRIFSTCPQDSLPTCVFLSDGTRRDFDVLNDLEFSKPGGGAGEDLLDDELEALFDEDLNDDLDDWDVEDDRPGCSESTGGG